MKFFRTYKLEIFISLILLVLYFTTRILTILQIPIFTDEAIYLRWTQIASQDSSWRFISLTDGKQPLYIWLAIVSMKLISDPLVAGRLVSVMAGFMSLVGLFFLGKDVFKNRWIGILSAGLYVIFPFSLVYDRLALYDSLVGTFAVWALYFTVRFLRSVTLENAFILGFVAGGAALNKSSGFFAIYLLPFGLLLFDFAAKKVARRLFTFAIYSLVAVVLTYAMYSILRLSPYFYIIAQKDAIFVYPISEWITHPFTYLWSNSTALFDWLVRYVGLPILLFALGSIFITKTYWREKILFLIWFGAPFAALALFGRTIYPRYILFMSLPLLVLASYCAIGLINKTKSTYGKLGIIFGLGIFSLTASFLILKDPVHSLMPRSDVTQLVSGWPSGKGVDESIRFFKEQASHEKIFIGTGGTFGLLPFAYEIYLIKNPQITIKGYWPIDNAFRDDLIEKAKTMKTFVVFYQDCPGCPGTGIAPADWNLKKVLQVRKDDMKSYYTVYQVL
ncbi:MAG: glycosyltransferase family 39 protein [Candidatus Levybacteria bacterium]|nr:glycosyltransferase family 39 protein [Candidatus Levybacteria bacterium]